MRLRTLILVSAVTIVLLQTACIGRQPMQQGTWSGQDGFKTKVSDQAGHSPEHPD